MAESPDREVILRQRLQERLQALDPRFGDKPRPHPFAEAIARGSAATGELLGVAEDAREPAERRADALEALRHIVSGLSADHQLAARLATLGTQEGLDPRVRGEAAAALIASGHPKFIKAFEVRLASDDPGVAYAAARAMGTARHKPAVPALIELVAKSPYPEVQSAAAAALGRIGDARGLEILVAAFKAGRILVPVITALAKLGGAELIPILTVTLSDTSPQVRTATAEALCELVQRLRGQSHASLFSYLKVALERETEPRVAASLVACMTRIGAPVPRELIEKKLGVDLSGPGG